MKEKTLGLIKPDAVSRGIIGEILAVIESEQFEIVGLRMIRLTRLEAEEFYSEHKDKPFFDDLVRYMTSGAVVAYVLERKNAIALYRELIGDTNPINAKEGTLRKLFAVSKNENSVHGSDSLESANREISLIFG